MGPSGDAFDIEAVSIGGFRPSSSAKSRLLTSDMLTESAGEHEESLIRSGVNAVAEIAVPSGSPSSFPDGAGWTRNCSGFVQHWRTERGESSTALRRSCFGGRLDVRSSCDGAGGGEVIEVGVCRQGGVQAKGEITWYRSGEDWYAVNVRHDRCVRYSKLHSMISRLLESIIRTVCTE